MPDLVPLRYGRMLVSPFTFYRGAALVMAADLAGTPSSGFRAQLCGDAHLSNFGVFATPERRMVFDINDFDETLPGPWEWDVKRLVASLAVAGRDNGLQPQGAPPGLHGGGRRPTASAMRGFAESTNLDVFYASIDVATLDAGVGRHPHHEAAPRSRGKRGQGPHARLPAGAEQADRDGRRRSGASSATHPSLVPIEALFPSSRRWTCTPRCGRCSRATGARCNPTGERCSTSSTWSQVARKVVGVGSVGTRSWIILLLGRDDGDPLFLQAKEAQPSVLEAYAGASAFGNQGRRVVAGQQLMQAASDIFLGATQVAGFDGRHRDFYLRQLRDGKGSADIEPMVPTGMEAYAGICAWTLARAHACSGDRIAIASYLGRTDRFEQAVAEFAETYADQNESDFHELEAAERTGRIKTVRGL